MNYKIFGENLPAVTIGLDKGEGVIVESGSMSWMSEHVVMETNMRGGFLKALGRMFTGESFFIATFTAEADGQEATFSSAFPGCILPLEVGNDKEYICQKQAFLCSQTTVEPEAVFMKGIKKGLFGGEGFMFQRLKGQGMAFLEIDGSVKELYLAPGQKVVVSTGNVAAFDSKVQYDVQMVKGFKNVLFGGEGLFLTTLTGPGKVYLQTMPMDKFASKLIPFLPKPTNSGGSINLDFD